MFPMLLLFACRSCLCRRALPALPHFRHKRVCSIDELRPRRNASGRPPSALGDGRGGTGDDDHTQTVSDNEPDLRDKNDQLPLPQLRQKLEAVEMQIYALNNNEKFNPNSPMQVKKVLFGDGAMAATTTKDVLRRMALEGNEMADLILQFRQIKAKLAKRNNPAAQRSQDSVTTEKDLPVSDQMAHFQLCTFNVWFGQSKDGFPHPEHRMRAIADLVLRQHLAKDPLWFVGFQEVTDPLAETLVPLLKTAGYEVIRQPLTRYGVALGIRRGKCTSVPQILCTDWRPSQNSIMGRGLLFAHCQLPAGRECIVATTHLESYMASDLNGAELRGIQIDEINRFCMEQFEKHPKLATAVVMGDMNWDDESQRPMDAPQLALLQQSTAQSGVSGDWRDAWEATNEKSWKNRGYTYDSKLNPMLGGTLRRRFDRCLVFQRQGTKVHIRSTEIIGHDPLPELTWPKLNRYTGETRVSPLAPSDHFGLVTRLSLE